MGERLICLMYFDMTKSLLDRCTQECVIFKKNADQYICKANTNKKLLYSGIIRKKTKIGFFFKF